MKAFGEILKGDVSPSGRTVDTYAADFTKDPTWENQGAALGRVGKIDGDAYLYEVGRGFTGTGAYFVDYEESIYVGYRYYETAHAEAQAGNYEGFDYDEAVVYPFGYGLSYTSFEWTLKNGEDVSDKALEKDTSLTFEVEVHNTGSVASREVVELYVTAPYKKNGIEKAAKVLVGFAKTKVIPADGYDTVSITVDSPYEFASYDYKDANKNGFKGYEVEAGDYVFTVGKNSHDDSIQINTTVGKGIKYEEDPVTGTKVENQYTDQEVGLNSDEQLINGVLSRADFPDTWPEARTTSEKNMNEDEDHEWTGDRSNEEWVDYITKSLEDPNRPEMEDGKVVTGANNGIKLADLVGLDYSSDKVIEAGDTPNGSLVGKTHAKAWELFLDQLTVKEMTNLANNGGFHTTAIPRLMVPQTTSADGPVGFCNFMGDPTVYDTCAYPCEVVLASTWNVDRLYDMGKAVGNEGLLGNVKGDGSPYSGWYAPGLNIHRTPFGGRNFEYYSEDCYLSGKMTAAVMEGAATKGVFVNLKHFALNEQETHRASNGVLTWATEQSIREVYLKGFEIAIKTAKAGNTALVENQVAQNGVKAMGVMSSFNRIGERWTGGDYRLCTEILRDEWGFEGLVICDFNTCGHMVEKDMIYAGGDLNLQVANMMIFKPDEKNNTDVAVLRQAAHNILYTVANSNAVRGDFVMVMSAWEKVMIGVDVALVIGFAAWGFFVIRRAFKLNKKATDSRKK